MSRGRYHYPLWSRRRVLVTPQGSAVANAIQSFILTPMMMLLILKLSSTGDEAVATLRRRRLRRTKLPRDRTSAVKSP